MNLLLNAMCSTSEVIWFEIMWKIKSVAHGQNRSAFVFSNKMWKWNFYGFISRKEPLKLSYSQTGELHLALDQLDDDTSEYSGKENEDVIIATSRTNGTVGNNSKKETGKRGFLSGLRNRRKSDGIKEKDDISLT